MGCPKKQKRPVPFQKSGSFATLKGLFCQLFKAATEQKDLKKNTSSFFPFSLFPSSLEMASEQKDKKVVKKTHVALKKTQPIR